MIGTTVGLIAAVGLIFVRGELGRRQERRSAEADNAVTDAHGKIARLQNEATTAQRALQELQERTGWRHITEQQKEQLLTRLRAAPKAKTSVWCVASDPEAHSFAKEIIAILQELSWDVEGPVMSLGGWQGAPRELCILVRDRNRTPELANILLGAFTDTGFPVVRCTNPDTAEGETKILVGNRLQRQ